VLELTDVLSETFDIIKGLLVGDAAKFTLLKETGVIDNFDKIGDVTIGWRPRYSEFFGATTIEVADITEGFAAKVHDCTHIVITESGIPSMNDVIFEMLPETAAPDADKPYWRIRIKSLGRKYLSGVEV